MPLFRRTTCRSSGIHTSSPGCAVRDSWNSSATTTHNERVRGGGKKRPRRSSEEGVGRAGREPEHKPTQRCHFDPGDLSTRDGCRELGEALWPRPDSHLPLVRAAVHPQAQGRSGAALFAPPVAGRISIQPSRAWAAQALFNGINAGSWPRFGGVSFLAPSPAKTCSSLPW